MIAQKQRRILVVDDVEDWRNTLSGLLLDEGYKVDTAGSLMEAMVYLDAYAFDLALLDVRLVDSEEGNTDGLKLASEIRDIWPKTKIVLITGYDTPEMVKQAREPDVHGRILAEDFIPKHKTADLLKIISSVFAQE